MSRAVKHITWIAEELQRALFSTYPHQPTPVDPGLLVLSIGLSNTPIIGDLYDFYTGVTGYDPVTKQYLAGWERLANIAGAIPILGLSGANIRHGVHAAESLIDSGDELAQFIGKACSFDEDTPVATDEGAIPIREVDVGDRVLAWHETLGREPTGRGYYTVTDAYTNVHEVLVYLTIDGEALTTTPEHPFLQADGEWAPAGTLEVGNQLRNADGEYGTVEAIEFATTPQVMYNMTVADAHTYTVGDGEWVVHNSCDSLRHLIPIDDLVNTKRVPTWVKLGTNDVGAVFMGTTRDIYQSDLTSALNTYGPGIILTGRHGDIYPLAKETEFYTDDIKLANLFPNLQVVNFNLVTRQEIMNMGGPGQLVYAAWCKSAACEILWSVLD